MNRNCLMGAVVLCAALTASCAWVKLTPEGESVSVASRDAVGECVRQGKVTVSLKNRVGAFERKPTKVADGDTVVAESTVADGRQVFGVYRCMK